MTKKRFIIEMSEEQWQILTKFAEFKGQPRANVLRHCINQMRNYVGDDV